MHGLHRATFTFHIQHGDACVVLQFGSPHPLASAVFTKLNSSRFIVLFPAIVEEGRNYEISLKHNFIKNYPFPAGSSIGRLYLDGRLVHHHGIDLI